MLQLAIMWHLLHISWSTGKSTKQHNEFQLKTTPISGRKAYPQFTTLPGSIYTALWLYTGRSRTHTCSSSPPLSLSLSLYSLSPPLSGNLWLRTHQFLYVGHSSVVPLTQLLHALKTAESNIKNSASFHTHRERERDTHTQE